MTSPDPSVARVSEPTAATVAQRQDSLADQMRDVMRFAVESGCYDAHDWLVKVWGTRHGICAHEAAAVYPSGRTTFCCLTAGHDGAHEDDSRPPMRWFEKQPKTEAEAGDEGA